jgi:hypothetical protein
MPVERQASRFRRQTPAPTRKGEFTMKEQPLDIKPKLTREQIEFCLVNVLLDPELFELAPADAAAHGFRLRG